MTLRVDIHWLCDRDSLGVRRLCPGRRPPGPFYQPTEILIIYGPALGAFIAANNGKAIKATFKAFSKLKRTNKYDKQIYMDLMTLLYKLLNKARQVVFLILVIINFMVITKGVRRSCRTTVF